MDLEERSGVDPVIERTCAECGTKLTGAEIQASLETGARSSAACTLRRRSPLEDAGA